MGTWSAEPIDIFLREIGFAEPTADLLSKRRAQSDLIAFEFGIDSSHDAEYRLGDDVDVNYLAWFTKPA